MWKLWLELCVEVRDIRRLGPFPPLYTIDDTHSFPIFASFFSLFLWLHCPRSHPNLLWDNMHVHADSLIRAVCVQLCTRPGGNGAERQDEEGANTTRQEEEETRV